MKHFLILFLIATITLTWLPGPILLASGCRTVIHRQQKQKVHALKKRVIVNKVVAVPVVAVAVEVPLYSAYYSQHSNQPPQQQANPELTRILQILDYRLARLEAGTNFLPPPATIAPGSKTPMPPASDLPEDTPADPATTPQADDPSLLSLFQGKCAACHEQAVAGTKGGRLILTINNTVALLTPAQKLLILGRTYRQEMPPPKNKFNIAQLSDEEQAALVDQLAK